MAYYSNNNTYASIYGGAEDDTIYNSGITHYSILDGGAGDDSIYTYQGNQLTIRGGKGNDTIRINSLYSNRHVIQYFEGDGNDYIYDDYFSPNWTLRIGDGTGTYSTQSSGSDKIVIVGDGKITLSGNSSSVNIAGTYSTGSSGSSKLITGTSGNDTLSNTVSGVTINALGGNDSISNYGANVTIDGGEGNDSIESGTWEKGYSSLSGGTGDDIIDNYGSNSTIIGGLGNDYICNNFYGSLTAIDGGDGDDTIDNYGSNVSINGGTGDDFISLHAGYDSIDSWGNNVLFKYAEGDGNDTIYGFRADSTLSIGGAEYSSSTSGNDLILTVGDGKISLVGAATLSTVNIIGTLAADSNVITGTEGSDTIQVFSEYTFVQALGGRDSIYDYYSAPNYSTIDAGDGNDTIKNTGGYLTASGWDAGNYLSINGGAGADYINNQGNNVTIEGGAGNDTIINEGLPHSTKIDGGAGNDSISNVGSNSTIIGGDGNDTIRIFGTPYSVIVEGGTGDDFIDNSYSDSDILYKYKAGDGNDIISTFNADDTLQIGDGMGTYSTQISGSNVIVTVGDGKISLIGAATLDAVNIIGEKISENPVWAINGTTATYGTNTETLITVSGVKSLDGISLSDKTVTIANSALNLANVTISDGYTLALASDVTAPTTTAASWSYSNNVATYKGASTTAGYTLDNNQIVYSAAYGGEEVQISGVKSATGLSIDGKVITVANAALNNTTVTVSDNTYTLSLASDVPLSTSTDVNWSHSGTTATYKSGATTAGYKLDNNQISYVPASGEQAFTVMGVKSTDGLSLSGNVVTVAASALNSMNVTISDGYTLALANDVAAPSTTAAAWSINNNVATYKAAQIFAGYTANGTQITYTPASGGNTLVTVSGVQSADGLSLSGNVVTVAASALNKANVTISDGYNLELANDVKAPTTTAAGWGITNNVATYKTSATTEGYTVSGNQIVYTAAGGGNTLVTVSGLKSLSGISLSGTTVTVANSALNGTNVTISEGYNLALADDAPKSITTAANWNLNGTTATYKGASTTAGYTLSNNQIIYTPASGGEEITITGVKSTDGISINGNIVTIAAAALNGETVTVSNGYNLALANDVARPTTTAAAEWSLSGNTATYKSAATSAGYSINNNQINYVPAVDSKTLIEVKGLSSTLGLSLSGTTVVVPASILNESDVTISEGYTLAMAAGVEAPTTTAESWKLNGNVATYTAASTTAGYTLSDNKITYTPASGGESFTVTGVKSTNGISINDKTITVSNAALNQGTVTISNGYTLALASDAPTPQTTNETWNISGDVATHKATATSAGYKLENNQITYTPATGGEEVQITGVKSTGGISINGNVITVANSALNQSNVTINNGNYTLALANDAPKSQTTPASWSHSGTTATCKTEATSEDYTLSNNQIIYTPASGGETVTVSGVKSTAGLSINDKTVTVANAALNQGTVTISDGYNLALANDVPAPQTTAANWIYNNDNTATYKAASTSAGYSVSNNQIVYSGASGGEEVQVSGVKSTTGLSINGNTITVANSALNQSNVTINNGDYTLALANDVPTSSTTAAAWNYNNNTAIYKHVATSAGYTISDNKINYIPASGGETVAINGVKSSDGLTINDKTITVANSALDGKTVTVSDGYILELDINVMTPATTSASWSYRNGTATYRSASTSAGYRLENNQINYIEASGGEQIQISGVKSSDGFTINGKVITVANSALNQAEVTISDGYELKLGDDVALSKTQTGWTKLDNGNMLYQTDSTTAGYKLENNKISYVEAVEGATLAELSGIDSALPPTLDENGITFAASNFEDNVAVIQSNTNNFEFSAGDYADKEFSGTDKIDKINNSGSNLIINGGAGGDKINNTGTGVTIEGGAGDDQITLSDDEGGNTYVYSDGDGKDILYNFKANDTIQVMGTAQVEANIKNKDVVFKVGKGTITVRDGATSEMAITLINSEGKAISENTYTASGIISDKKIELAESLKKPYTQAEDINEVDGSKVKDGANITGNSNGGKILGGAGNDTLISSEGDFEFTGGAGNDLFIFGGGDDTITDYSQSDKVSLGSLTATGYEIDGDDLILEFDNNNALTIQNGKGKEITFAGKKSTVNIYGNEGIFDGKKKSLTLAAGTEDSFSAAKLSKLVTIDGSQVEGELTITGNKKANLIIAGKSNTTLNGGKGKDTLVGGEGEDVFIYDNKSGNKTIQNYNYEDGDVISFGKGAEISQVTSKKGGVVLKVGSNTITIENTEKFNFTQGDETKTYNNKMLINGDSVTLSSDFKGTFSLEENESYNHVSAELGKKTVNLIGDAGENILTGGKGKDTLNGGANQDTLDGGKGNDILWGGSDDADTFIYRAGDGTDTIMDYNYDDGDLLQILDKNGKEISNPIKKHLFDGDDLILSIKGGGKIILANFATSETKTIRYNNDTKLSF